MKAIFGKNRAKKPSAGETAVHVSGGESGRKESEQPNPPKRRDIYSSTKNLVSENINNPEFRENESNTYSAVSNRSGTLSSSRGATGSFQEKKGMNHDKANMTSISEMTERESKNLSDERREGERKSHEAPSRSSEKFLLKKTQEISDINLKKFHEINMTEGFQCPVERLALENEKRTSPDPCDTEISLFDEIDLAESQSGDCKTAGEKLLNYAPLRRRRALKKRPRQSHNEQNEGFWSKKSFFNKARLVNFFWEKNENASKRSEFIQMNMSEKGDAKPTVLVERFVYPKVPLEEDLQVKQYFRDFFFYIIYLVLLTAIAVSMVSSDMYYFTSNTASLFMNSRSTPTNNSEVLEPSKKNSKFTREKSLRKLFTFEDFWEFAETTMIDLFYWNFFYAGEDPLTHTEEDDKKMFYENQILGVPRLRQVRVRDDSCKIHPKVRRFFDTCYSYYSPFTEETRPIREDMENSMTSTAWVYTKAENLHMSQYWGEISIYGGGGYYLDLDTKKEKAQAMIKELKQNFWLSRATRAVFIDFNLYNANVNLFCLCKIVLEFPPVGGIIPKADFLALKLIRYLKTFDFFILGCEFVLILFFFHFNWELFKKAFQQKGAFFLSFWNYFDLTIVLLLCVFFILSIIRYTSTDHLIRQLGDRFHQYTEFNFVKKVQISFNNITAALLFASWIKLFTFLTFSKSMLEFRKTLQKSIINILGFLPMLLTMFFAFAILANLLFGSEIKNCRSVWYSSLFLLQALMGEFKYDQIQESERILGPLFYLSFIFFVFFVLMNVFIAIISNAYSKVKSEVLTIRPHVGRYAKTGMINAVTCCQLRKKLKKETSVKKKLIFEEMYQTLKMSGFSADEIRIFFLKYKIDEHNILDKNTRRKVMEDLELKRVDFEGSEKDSQFKFLRRRINNLSSKIDEVETNLQPVIDKVDVLLERSSSKKYS